MKRLLALFLIISILLLLLCGCMEEVLPTDQTQVTTEATEPVFAYPVQGGDVSLTMFVGNYSGITTHYDTRDETRVAVALKEATGIFVDYIDDYADYDAVWKEMVETAKATDMICFNVLSYGIEKAEKEGLAMPLNDIIDAYMPNFKAYLEANPDIDRMIKSDNGIYYFIPFVNSVTGAHSYGAFYREDLLKEMGEEEPKTVQQWHDLLVKVKDRYGITPMACDLNGLLRYGMIAMAYGVGGNSTSNDFALDDSGEVFYQRGGEEWKAFLTEMHKWYEEGLIEPDVAGISSSDVNAKMIQGKVFLSMGWLTGSMQNVQMYGEKLYENFQLKAVATPALNEGETPEWAYATNRISGQGVTISRSCENVELAARFLDFLFTEDGHLLANFGIEGESYDLVDGIPTFRYEITHQDPVQFVPPEGYKPNPMYVYSMNHSYALPFVCSEYYYPQLIDQEVCVEAIDVWGNVKGGGFLHQIPYIWTLDTTELDRVAPLLSQLKQHSTDWAVQFIRGEKDIEADWAEYIATLEEAGLKTAHTIISNAMERYNAR